MKKCAICLANCSSIPGIKCEIKVEWIALRSKLIARLDLRSKKCFKQFSSLSPSFCILLSVRNLVVKIGLNCLENSRTSKGYVEREPVVNG